MVTRQIYLQRLQKERQKRIGKICNYVCVGRTHHSLKRIKSIEGKKLLQLKKDLGMVLSHELITIITANDCISVQTSTLSYEV